MANEIKDPFSWCYDRIFSLLEAHEPFHSMFKPKNVIRWDGGRNDPQKLSLIHISEPTRPY